MTGLSTSRSARPILCSLSVYARAVSRRSTPISTTALMTETASCSPTRCMGIPPHPIFVTMRPVLPSLTLSMVLYSSSANIWHVISLYITSPLQYTLFTLGSTCGLTSMVQHLRYLFAQGTLN